jgi:hypothetical protein
MAMAEQPLGIPARRHCCSPMGLLGGDTMTDREFGAFTRDSVARPLARLTRNVTRRIGGCLGAYAGRISGGERNGQAYPSLNALNQSVGAKFQNAWRSWYCVEGGKKKLLHDLRKEDSIRRRSLD